MMKGQITHIKAQTEGVSIYCNFTFEALLTIDEFNKIMKTFEEGVLDGDINYTLTQKGKYLTIVKHNTDHSHTHSTNHSGGD